MIESKQLRLGNWINCHFQTTNFNAKVLAIDLTNNIAVKDGNNIDWYGSEGNVDPIPLTPAILEAAGFVKDGFNQYELSINPFDTGIKKIFFSGDYLYLQQGRHEVHPSLHDLVTLWNKDFMKEFYLHQLQNLYFSLTGEELEIKMPIV